MVFLNAHPFFFRLIHQLFYLVVRRGVLSLHQRPFVDLIFKDSSDGHGAPFRLFMCLEIVLYADSKTVLIFHRG